MDMIQTKPLLWFGADFQIFPVLDTPEP